MRRDAWGRYLPPEGSTQRQREQFYQDLKRKGRASEGRCRYCGRFPEPGRKQCERHLEMARRRNAVARERRRAKAEAARRAALPRSCSGCGGGDLVRHGWRGGRQLYTCKTCGRRSFGDGPLPPPPDYPCPYCRGRCVKFGRDQRVRRHPQLFRCTACLRMNTNLWPEDTPSPGGPFPHQKTFNLSELACQALCVYCQEKMMSIPQAIRDIFIRAAAAPVSFIRVGSLRSYGEVSPHSSPRTITSAGPPLPVIPPGGVQFPSAMPAALEKLVRMRYDGHFAPTVLVSLVVSIRLSDLALASLLEMMRRRGLNHQDTARALIAETNAPKRVWASPVDDGGVDGW